jgi:hypothetical protein
MVLAGAPGGSEKSVASPPPRPIIAKNLYNGPAAVREPLPWKSKKDKTFLLTVLDFPINNDTTKRKEIFLADPWVYSGGEQARKEEVFSAAVYSRRRGLPGNCFGSFFYAPLFLFLFRLY